MLRPLFLLSQYWVLILLFHFFFFSLSSFLIFLVTSPE